MADAAQAIVGHGPDERLPTLETGDKYRTWAGRSTTCSTAFTSHSIASADSRATHRINLELH